EHAVPAQAGMYPLLIALSGPFGAVAVLLFSFAFKYRVVVVTDRAMLVFKTTAFRPLKPTELIDRLARATPLVVERRGVLVVKASLGGSRYGFPRRFRGDLEDAIGASRSQSALAIATQ